MVRNIPYQQGLKLDIANSLPGTLGESFNFKYAQC